MNLVVGSCFRNSGAAHVAAYRARIQTLQHACAAKGITLHVIVVWGDSTNDTAHQVQGALGTLGLHEVQILERNHGFPDYGSSEHPERLAGFAYAANGVFEAVGAGADVVIYVESDLIWAPAALLTAAGRLHPGEVDILGIPTFCGSTHVFYDTWAFRTPDGRRFGALPPYWEAMHLDRLERVQSVGGCVVMTGAVARVCRCSKEEALVGLCKDAASRGYHVWSDWRLRVEHP